MRQDRPNGDYQQPIDILVDLQPDERGNVAAMAIFHGGRMIAIDFNAN